MRSPSYRTWPAPVPEPKAYAPIAVKVWHYMRIAGGVHTAEHLETKLKVSRKSIKRALSFLAERRHVVLEEWWTRCGRKAYWSVQLTLHDELVGDLGMGTFGEVPVPAGDLGKGTSPADHAVSVRRSAVRRRASMSPCHDRGNLPATCGNTPSEGVAEGSALYRSLLISTDPCVFKQVESSGGEAASTTNTSSAMGTSATAAPSQANAPTSPETGGAKGVARPSRFRRTAGSVAMPKSRAEWREEGKHPKGKLASFRWDPQGRLAEETDLAFGALLIVLKENNDEVPRHHERIKANIQGWLQLDFEIRPLENTLRGLASLFHIRAFLGRRCSNPGNPEIFEFDYDTIMDSGSVTHDSDEYRWAFRRLCEIAGI